MTDLNGKEMNCPAFTIAKNVEVYKSCAVIYKGQFFVYGGSYRFRQIATVRNKTLTNVGDLPFDFQWGACSSTTSKIILCFHSYGDRKTCYQTKNPTGQFKETQKSIHNHFKIRIASSECKFITQCYCLDCFR